MTNVTDLQDTKGKGYSFVAHNLEHTQEMVFQVKVSRKVLEEALEKATPGFREFISQELTVTESVQALAQLLKYIEEE